MLLRSQCEEDADLPALISEKQLCHIQHEYDAADGRDAKAHPDLLFGVAALEESSLDQRAAKSFNTVRSSSRNSLRFPFLTSSVNMFPSFITMTLSQ